MRYNTLTVGGAIIIEILRITFKANLYSFFFQEHSSIFLPEVALRDEEGDSLRLRQASNNDPLSREQGVAYYPENVINDIPESEKNNHLEDTSPSTGNNLGFMIDRVSRILFPSTYAALTVAYFVFM